MSDFLVPVVSIRAIEPIENADLIELAVVGDYRSVVRKGQYKPGDLAAYIPEAAIVPPDLLEKMGLTGKLSGAAKNRVKAIRLRGCLSQGILCSLDAEQSAPEGADVAATLGIVKYEPTLPTQMMGEMGTFYGQTLRFDIENIKSRPGVIEEGEPVEYTEKLHGTFCGITMVPGLDSPDALGGDFLVYSKGLGAKGFVFKDVEANAGNVYLQAVKAADLPAKLRAHFGPAHVTLLGEVYGRGVQDLNYGLTDKAFAAFEIYVGKPTEGAYLDRDALRSALTAMSVPRVPLLYSGPFSRATMLAHTEGSTVAGAAAHMREGVVVTPRVERRDWRGNRVIVKSVSATYLLRKGETTEFA